MSALKNELINYINIISDEKLIAIKPLLYMLSNDTLIIEKLSFDDLSDTEKASIIQSEYEYSNGETVSHNDIDWN